MMMPPRLNRNQPLGYALYKVVTICALVALLAGLLPTPAIFPLPLRNTAKAVQAADAPSDEEQPSPAAVVPSVLELAQGGNDSEAVAAAPVVQNNETLAIGNYVWKDTNANGLQDSGEPGLPGVDVGLYDSSGKVVTCPEPGVNGAYQDQLTIGSINESDGTLDWDTNWRLSGDVSLNNSAIKVDGATTAMATRAVDLAVFADQPTLSFDYLYAIPSSFSIQYSIDKGATFVPLATLNVTPGSWRTITYTLPITATVVDAAIRIRGAASAGLYAWFDNLKLQGQLRTPVTAVTDANGLYTFTSARCVQPNTAYQVRIATAQTPLVNLTLITPDASGVTSNSPNDDAMDSDATPLTVANGSYAKINITSPITGVNDSYDFGFAPTPVGSLQVNKQVNGNASATSWRFTLSAENCALPLTLTNPLTTTNGASGTVTFANLLTEDTLGNRCQYAIREQPQSGWSFDYLISDALTGIQLTANTTTVVDVTNYALQACNAGAGDVGGLVFQDFNMDGQQNSPALEPGYADSSTVVRAYGKHNQLLAETPLQADGSYRFANLPNLSTDGVRIEFQNIPDTLSSTSYTGGTTTKRTSFGTVRFVKSPTCNIDLGVNWPANYCQSNPNIVATAHPFPSLYSHAGTALSLLNGFSAGATWGSAYHSSTKTLYLSAVTKSGANYGPLGSGGIYAVDLRNPSVPVGSSFVDLQTLGVETGFSSSSAMSVTGARAGKDSLGDMDIAEDGNTLYIMNLLERELVSLDIASKSVTQKVAVPDPGCMNSSVTPATAAPQDRRPWGINVHNGQVYIGVVCSAETSQLVADQHAYIMRLVGNETANPYFAPFFDFAMPTLAPNGTPNLAWRDTASGTLYHYQPMLADMAFDSDGALFVSTMSRVGLMGINYIHNTQGALIKIPLVNGQYDFSAKVIANDYPDFNSSSIGGLALAPGSGQIISAGADWPNQYNAVVWWDTADISSNTGIRSTNLPEGFVKMNGAGDIELLCDPAPLEIGNRVWSDSVQPNGVQDPNEAGIPGVVVSLYNITGTVIATTTTNSSGTYYFNSSNVSGGVQPNTNYTIRIAQNQAALSGLNPTLLNQVRNTPIAPDEHDSDGNPATYVGYVTTPVHTGSAGQNDYSYAFGFTAALDWGDNPDIGATGPGSYNTTVTNTGAAHIIVAGLHLGASVDDEADGQPTVGADGDGSDEDGVQFPPLKADSSATITVTATNTGTQAAILVGWLDFNGDGQFAASERLTTTVPAGTSNGVFYLTYSVPVDAVNSTYARFRLSTAPTVVNPTSVVTDGEVEDYPIAIQTSALAQFGDRVWLESDGDGYADAGVITVIAGMVITAADGTNVYTVTTNSDGYYSFIVPGGTYTVTYGSVPALYGIVVPSTVVSGTSVSGNAGAYREGGNPDANHGQHTTVTVAAGEANWQVDFAFTLPPSADLHLSKRATPAVVAEGGTLTYTLTLVNEGQATAQNVTIQDTLPTGVTYVRHIPAADATYDAATRTIQWSLSSLSATATTTLTIVVTAD